MLDEARDGLHDATADLVSKGWALECAHHRAIADFGVLAVVAPDYQRHLAIAQARRTAVAAMLALPALGLAWSLLWTGSSPTDPGSSALRTLNQLTDSIAVLTTLTCLVGVGLLSTAGRLVTRSQRLAWAVSVLTLAGVAATAFTSIAMVVLDPAGNATVVTASPAGGWVVAATVLAMTGLLGAAVRAVRCASSSAMAPDRLT